MPSAVFSGGAGGARAPPEFGGSQKGRSLISAYQSLAITTNTPGFEKLNTALISSSCFGSYFEVNHARWQKSKMARHKFVLKYRNSYFLTVCKLSCHE